MFKAGDRFYSLVVLEKVSNGWRCLCDCGNFKDVQKSTLELGRIRSCGCRRSSNLRIMTHGKFGNITPLKRIGRGKCLCLCDCGKEFETYENTLFLGNMLSCVECGVRKPKAIGKYKRGKDNPSFTGYNDISGSFFKKFIRQAHARNIHVEISVEDIWEKYENQNHKCNLSDIDILFSGGGKKYRGLGTVSIDRIDSNKPYIIENIQLLHKDVNLMKYDYDQDYFLSLCKEVSLFDGKFGNDFVYVPKKYHGNYQGIGDLSRNFFCNLISNATKSGRKFIFDLSIEYLWDLFLRQNAQCAISGKKIVMCTNYSREFENTCSLDRIDSNIGYIKSNVQWTHKNINQMKWNLDSDKFKEICGKIYDKTK